MEYIGVGPDPEPDTTVNWLVNGNGYSTNGVPVEITRGWRCPERNENVGGKDWSWHMFGGASDLAYAIDMSCLPNRTTVFLYTDADKSYYDGNTSRKWVILQEVENE